MNTEKLNELRIDPSMKARPKKSYLGIFILVLVLTGAAVFYAIPRKDDNVRLFGKENTAAAKTNPAAAAAAPGKASTPAASSAASAPPASAPGETILTVSGYVIPRERIELSPRFMGTVKWIGVKKGDAVTNHQVVVLLDDAEYRARQQETAGRLASAEAALRKAQLQYERVKALASASIESRQAEDDMRLNVEAAQAMVQEINGQLQWIDTYIEWCVIRSPIDGVVLEKLVDPNELVTPQSFGGTRGPSTALISVANLKDLQVEIDLNEADVAKAFVGQKCKISPEAYPDKSYDGHVAEKAPEANRQKGTLQVKVQIENPDRFLTPELTAKVDFLAGPQL
jgi:HlyD family secretion protein